MVFLFRAIRIINVQECTANASEMQGRHNKKKFVYVFVTLVSLVEGSLAKAAYNNDGSLCCDNLNLLFKLLQQKESS